jgi:acyl carrier protein phosphodiesterase
MARRTTFDSGMENAIFDLKNNYTTFENDFREFFPDLIEFCKNYIISPKN